METERYQLAERIGEGGAGEVFKAWDRQLGRHVAIKILKGEDPLQKQRLFFEAKILAQVGHEHICQVYETGEINGSPFLALQYIPGVPLDQMEPEATLDQKVLILAQVAEAIHAAHRKGLIHRDLKPANILVERLEDGSLKPTVMDFGLALSDLPMGYTHDGMLMGTPSFMAPEQAKGEEALVDRRSDVYSLGATLYALLTGEPPLGRLSAMEALNRLEKAEPRALRELEPHLPRDLEIITAKCLERDPARRYQTAKELAEDLRRFLAGEAIQAHPTGWLEWLFRWTQKNRGLFRAALLALTTVLLALGMALRVSWRARTQSEWATRFGSEAKEIQLQLRNAYLLPLHDTRRDMARVRVLMEGIRTSMSEQHLSEAAGHYALGTGHMVLGEFNEARNHLERAWTEGFQGPEVALALGRTLGELYGRARLQTARILEEPAQKERMKEIQQTLLQPALTYLRMGAAQRPETRKMLEALIAYYEESYQEALDGAKAAYEHDPALYEALHLQGKILVAKGDSLWKTEPQKAVVYFQQAEAPYLQALEMARSDPWLLLDEGVRQVWMLRALILIHAPVEEAYARAQSALEKALAAYPDHVEAIVYRSRAARYLAYHESHRGGPFQTYFQFAQSSAERAVELNPRSTLALEELGTVLQQYGSALSLRGEDASPILMRSVETFERSLAVEPGNGPLHQVLAGTLWHLADDAFRQGSDPRSFLERGLNHVQLARKVNLKSTDAFSTQALLYGTLGEYQMSHGVDPEEALRKAIESCEEEIRVSPADANARNNLADACMVLGRHFLRIGKDPVPILEVGLAKIREARDLDPKDDVVRITLAQCLWVLAETWMHQGKDPESLLAEARRELLHSVEINPAVDTARWVAAQVELLSAQWVIQKGRAPQDAFTRARTHLKEALRLNKNSPEAYLEMARMEAAQAQWKAKGGRISSLEIEDIFKYIDRTLELHPRQGEAHALKLELLEKQLKHAGPEERRQLDQAIQETRKKVLELNPYLLRKG